MVRVNALVLFLGLFFCAGISVGATPAKIAGEGSLERQKVNIEQARLGMDSADKTATRELANDRFEFEKQKAQADREIELTKVKWTAASVAGPLVIALLAWIAQVWAKIRDEKLQFQLKAAEIVMNSRETPQAKSKAEMLVRLFPQHLKHLGEVLEDEKKPMPYFGPSVERREELLKLLAEYPGSRMEILKTWKIIFPWDSESDWSAKSPVQKAEYRWFNELYNDDTINRNASAPPTDAVGVGHDGRQT